MTTHPLDAVASIAFNETRIPVEENRLGKNANPPFGGSTHLSTSEAAAPVAITMWLLV